MLRIQLNLLQKQNGSPLSQMVSIDSSLPQPSTSCSFPHSGFPSIHFITISHQQMIKKNGQWISSCWEMRHGWLENRLKQPRHFPKISASSPCLFVSTSTSLEIISLSSLRGASAVQFSSVLSALEEVSRPLSDSLLCSLHPPPRLHLIIIHRPTGSRCAE